MTDRIKEDQENTEGIEETKQRILSSFGEIGSMMEIRHFTNDQKEDFFFPVLVLDSPKKWLTAKQRALDFELTANSSSVSHKFRLHGVSFSEWRQLEEMIDMPDLPEGMTDEDIDDPELLAEREYAQDLRRAYILEFSTGNSIPGDTPEQKVDFIRKRNPGDFDALYSYIQFEVCCLMNLDGRLVKRYNEVESSNKQVVNVSSFDDWQESSSFILRFQRPEEDYIIEVPIKSISAEKRRKIEDTYKRPSPPKIPKIDPKTGRFSASESEPNFKDPSWRRKSGKIEQAKMIAYFEETVFPIPGSTEEEKFEWFGERLVGDVSKIKQFIEEEVVSSQSRYDFFTRYSYLLS